MKDKNILKFQLFYFVLVGAVGAFTPYINVYLENSIELSGSQIGVITAIALVIGVCVIPLWGIIGDKTKKYNILLLVSLALTLVVLYFYSKQRVYIGCLVCALALEIARLGSNPMADTITMNYTSEHNGNYGSIRAMGSLGYMLISMLVGFLADIFGLDGPMFTTYMVLVGIAILLCLTFPKTTSKKTEEVKKGSFKDLLTDKNFLFILVLTIVTSVVVDNTGKYAGNHLVSTLNGSASLISWSTFSQVLPEVLFLTIAVKIIDKIGYKMFYLISAICMAIRMFVYAFIPNPYIFVAVGVVHCLGVACQTVGNLAYLKQTINPAVFGTSITLLNAAIQLGGAIYSYLFGVIYELKGSFAIFTIGGMIVLVGIAMILHTKRFNHMKTQKDS